MSSDMYKLERSIYLVTTASPIIQNLALLDAHENIISDSLAVIHEGFINYIPILNTLRRCKYVGVDVKKKQLNKAVIFVVKWFAVHEEIFFVALSSLGMHIYNNEISDQLFYYNFPEMLDHLVMPVGCCVFQDITLCVGLSNGKIYLFQIQSNAFEVILKCELGENVTFVDGNSNYFVAISTKSVTFWEYTSVQFYNQKVLYDDADLEPTVLKTAKFYIIIGTQSGEVICHAIDNRSSDTKVYAHNKKITCIDFSDLQNFIITGSLDKFVKIWQVCAMNAINLLFSVDVQHEICGVGFMNFKCIEFCIVKSNSTVVDVYNTDDFYDFEENYDNNSDI